MKTCPRHLLVGLGLLLLAFSVCAKSPPRIAIVIDDMGNGLRSGRAALALPGRLTYAFLPHTPYAARLAKQAYLADKEVMLHLPMQALHGGKLGPGALKLHMGREAYRRTLQTGLESIPHVAGVNNHMGSLLTRHPGAMQWLMDDLRGTGLYFIDSRTSLTSVAEEMAQENAIPVARRDVFLDSVRDVEEIRRQYRRLLRLAKRSGTAIAIGHPYPETLRVLAEELPKLSAGDIQLVPASKLTKTYVRKKLWRVSSSLSPKVAKNSKPSPSSTCCEEPASKSSSPDLPMVR